MILTSRPDRQTVQLDDPILRDCLWMVTESVTVCTSAWCLDAFIINEGEGEPAQLVELGDTQHCIMVWSLANNSFWHVCLHCTMG